MCKIQIFQISSNIQIFQFDNNNSHANFTSQSVSKQLLCNISLFCYSVLQYSNVNSLSIQKNSTFQPSHTLIFQYSNSLNSNIYNSSSHVKYFQTYNIIHLLTLEFTSVVTYFFSLSPVSECKFQCILGDGDF